ncbi:magnesium transporter CorA family protein [Gottfriedia acidiceleris]|uniref:Magnesium transporter CorA family protein n=1 Tax=Gottfriedia acidiceleris TaxID=371036 RepID=A0ABY4JQD6_9BACI|nr:magnesium transporter CorA family protein [Gottfriedia acidiceleris]UPM56038.1 magnesium transporter CorA family protein [Gottfriedia acidiceleris]
MLNFYLSDAQGKLNQVDVIEKGCWINAINPTEQEIQYLVQKLDLDLDFIKDPLDDEERSRIEVEGEHTLIIVDIPIVAHDDNGHTIFDTIPIGMIISSSTFVTICLSENPIFERFIYQKVKGFFTFKKTRFALQLLHTTSSYYLRYLKQINRKTNEIEAELHQSTRNQELFTMLNLEKSLVYFTTSLKSNKIVMQKILKGNILKMYEDDEDLLEDVIIENKQAIEMAEVYSNILSGMMNTFASVISNNLNIVMKFLTSITIILSIPTMVSSFYGMNVDNIPLAKIPHAFSMVIGISAILSTTIALIFWKKRYF